MIHLDYYYERDIPYSPQANQELIAALVNKNYIIYNGTDFGIKKKNTPLKWDDAEADCVKDKGHLYRINSLFKREILERYLSDITFSSGEDFHVGLKKINGTWMWFDGGTDVFYLRPEGQNENCSRYFDKNITSTMCANTNEYLCEVSISV
ncbi:hypothetical protein LOTGIDRAFT_167962 [Lottia gigantea]|uniref:C-type lectin domain-containing protein n=1 Tax=Lottia gigantea TaxID=225164 RepID=V3ZRJ3_LOTGI|nr:hypothetical protein LOTGIDRAFT_167962 [Lottia gigantea]ESO85175.1 hypothetical protein LOTGIDRAFT_167962 [Lottia gigantea]